MTSVELWSRHAHSRVSNAALRWSLASRSRSSDAAYPKNEDGFATMESSRVLGELSEWL